MLPPLMPLPLTLRHADRARVMSTDDSVTVAAPDAESAERMVEQGEGGRIVNVSSQAGKLGWPLLGAYSSAKAGVVLLTQVMAKEWGPSGITVNAVCPGTVDTDLLNPGRFFEALMDSAEPGGMAGWLEREVPLGRLQEPHEVASAIAFLCSDDAAYITGEALNVSGGQTMA